MSWLELVDEKSSTSEAGPKPSQRPSGRPSKRPPSAGGATSSRPPPVEDAATPRAKRGRPIPREE